MDLHGGGFRRLILIAADVIGNVVPVDDIARTCPALLVIKARVIGVKTQIRRKRHAAFDEIALNVQMPDRRPLRRALRRYSTVSLTLRGDYFGFSTILSSILS